MLLTRRPAYVHHLNTPLIQLSKRDTLTLGDLTQGCMVFGASGSGKTSGSMRTIIQALLRAGCGGMFLVGKTEDADILHKYAKEADRADSVIRFSGEGDERFNFLEHEHKRGGAGAGETFNMVAMLMRLVEVLEKSAGDGNAAFWRNSCKVLLTHAINAVLTAYGTVELDALQKMVITAPTAATPTADPEWRKRSFCWQTLKAMEMAPQGRVSHADQQASLRYWMEEHARLDEKTRSNIHASLTALLYPFLTGRMRELFTTRTTVVPEMTHYGAILIIDMPVLAWGDSGLLAMQLWKYAFQQAANRRVVDETSRPIFLIGDEYQLFCHAEDATFQSTCRSAKVCTLYATQSLPSLYLSMGKQGHHPEHSTHALLTNFHTKIFHANSCNVTNHYASELIGKGIQYRRSISQGTNQSKGKNWGNSRGYSYSSNAQSGGSRGSNFGSNYGGSTSQGSSHSTSINEQIDYLVQPSFFVQGMKRGGEHNQYKVDALLFQSGMTFHGSRQHFMLAQFDQRLR